MELRESGVVQKMAGRLQTEELHARNGNSPISEARLYQTSMPLPSSLQSSTEQPPWSPLPLIPTSKQRPFYSRSPTAANNQLAEARPGLSSINHTTVSSRSALSPSVPNVQGSKAAQYRQLPRLKTLITQNTISSGRDASPLINELERSPGKESRRIQNPVPVSAYPDFARESSSGHIDVPAVRPIATRKRSATTSHSLTSDAAIPLRPSNSIPDIQSVESVPVRSRNHHTPLRHYRCYREQDAQESDYSGYPSDTSPRYDRYDLEQARTSFRSGVTTGSSFMGNSSTERDSFMTGASLSPDEIEENDGGMSVDEAIGMYERGFQDDDEEEDEEAADEPGCMVDNVDGLPETPLDSQIQIDEGLRHGSAELITMAQAITREMQNDRPPLPPEDQPVRPPGVQPIGDSLPYSIPRPQPPPLPRDRYGFRKETQYITVAQYDAWYVGYERTLERRRRKWIALMRRHGLPTEFPVNFPRRSSKVRRFVRKGIPPEWRGAAWFWYAGGHAYLARHPGLYDALVHQAENGEINRNDREMIERDLNRTFPDNIRFKPDPTVSYDTAGNAGGGGGSGSNASRQECPLTSEHNETAKLKSLRRVLQAFSIHNPKIGYCQSLNFLAGLLLLFMNEVKTFWMLNIITSIYLPGTHSINLEGANVDLAVLMTSIEESLPAIWTKINDSPPNTTDNSHTTTTQQHHRLPTISLCTTSWFMSCFIGTLPIETVLRVWDSFFYEGSKILFHIALTIFKLGEAEIRAVNDPMEVFLVVQTIPRKLIDASALMETCFKRGNGFNHLNQQKVDERRRRWREILAEERVGEGGDGGGGMTGDREVESRGGGREMTLMEQMESSPGDGDSSIAGGGNDNNSNVNANANPVKGKSRLNRIMTTMNGKKL